jgi:hypothetical protein
MNVPPDFFFSPQLNPHLTRHNALVTLALKPVIA